MPTPDYEYDVFFSYKRDPLILDWIDEVVRRFRFWLTQEMGGAESRVFLDRQRIDMGEHWPEALKAAIRSSRCLVGVWSPSYFQSAWCISEWRSFVAREEVLGLVSPHGLIAPVRFHDGEYFPTDAAAIQSCDVSSYTATLPAFWQTQRAVEFEDVLKTFAHSVAAMIRRAPPFRPDWPIVEAPPLDPPVVPLRRL